MATTLNVLCGICSEFYKSNDSIYVTRCGHVFHEPCLFHWLRMSHSCPQCRGSCLSHQCHRVFLNFEPLPSDYMSEDQPPPIPSSGYEWLHIDRDMDEDILKTFAFHYGPNEDGDNIYAARGFYNGDLIPAYYCPKKRAVVAAWGFKSHLLTGDIEILDISCDDAEYKWIAAAGGGLPDNAFITGRTIRHEPLYTARAVHNDRILYGKLHLIYNSAYVPFGEEEVCCGNYEVLARIPKAQQNVENNEIVNN